MARRDQRLDLKRYLGSALLVLTATLFTFAIRPFFGGKSPLVFFIVAVILSAAYGGISTGLFTTALSFVIAALLVQDRVFPLMLAQSSLTLFAFIGIAAAVVVGKLRELNQSLIEARDNLQAANKELELANQKLGRQSEILSDSNEELQRFAYGLAHDLHNPLRSIGALTDLLIGRNTEKMDQSSKECARMIVDGVNRMESMIKSLLDYAAAVEAHGDQAVADGNVVVERVLQDLHYVIETSGTLVKCDPLPTVRIEEGHLAQVFSNLIGNAIKYRSALKPEVRIQVEERPTEWLFAVKDNGIGLDMQHADNIFGMFKRLHNSARYEGSGVGLALCKVVIQRNGGRIWVESELGKGSTFFFTIPKAEKSEETGRPLLSNKAAP